MHIFFFSTQTFRCFFTCIELVIPWGVFINHVDLKGGGEVNFSSCINDLVHSASLLPGVFGGVSVYFKIGRCKYSGNWTP